MGKGYGLIMNDFHVYVRFKNLVTPGIDRLATNVRIIVPAWLFRLVRIPSAPTLTGFVIIIVQFYLNNWKNTYSSLDNIIALVLNCLIICVINKQWFRYETKVNLQYNETTELANQRTRFSHTVTSPGIVY